MSAPAVSLSPAHTAAGATGGRRVGLVVAASVASGLALGLVLVLGVVGGAVEATIVGAALLALGAGFGLLAVASARLTDQPQPWAVAPAAGAALAGLALVVLTPGDRALALAGWIWPALLALLVGWSVRGAQRSLRHRSRRAVLYPALAILSLIAVAGAVETVRQATETSPAPHGRTYLVDGHRLYLSCVGTGAPTVILFNGLGERTPSWAWVHSTVSSSTRVCAFDRAGQGWSGAGPGAQDGHEVAADLHGLLRAARIAPPYVLAGHSVGGAYAMVYAARYPQQVAGVALVDSTTPDQFELPDYPRFYSLWRRGSALLPSLGRIGLTRLGPGAGFGGLPAGARREARAFAAAPRELRSDRVEFLMLPTVFDQAKALRSLGTKPLAVISATVGSQRGWEAAQDELARLSTNSVHRAVPGASHAALLEDRRFAAVTADAIEGVVAAAR